MPTTPKLKELLGPKLIHYASTVSCYKHTKFHAIPLNGYGERASKHFTIQKYNYVMTFTIESF